MANTLFSYINDILSSEGNHYKELVQVIDCVMEGKSDEEQREVVEKMLRDGMVRMLIGRSEIDLLHFSVRTQIFHPFMSAQETLSFFENGKSNHDI